MGYEVFLKGLRFRACHGVLPQERTVGGEFVVDVTMHVGDSPAAHDATLTDDIADAVDYARLYATVKREMGVTSALLEHAARRIARALLDMAPAAIAVDITLTKVNPPMGADCTNGTATAAGAGVTLHLTNDKNLDDRRSFNG